MGENSEAVGEAFSDVLHAAQSGAGWALERLYHHLAPAVNGYLRMQRAAEPEDLTNEVFLGVFRNLGSFRGSETKFRSWVFTIAHRRLQDERRRAARRPHLAAVTTDAELPLSAGDVEQDALAVLGEQWVMTVTGVLSAEQRTVLLLRVVADLTAEQVAEITGKTVGAVRAMQRRALETLRRELASDHVTGTTAGSVQK